MSSIGSIGGNSPIQQTAATQAAKASETPTTAETHRQRAADKVELSGMTHLMASLKAGGDVRAEKIAAIKQQINDGTYEDDHKLDVAADRLLDEIQK